MRVVLASGLVLVAVASGCSDDATDSAQGAAGGGGEPSCAQEPAPPAEPALPAMTPCPRGWREVPGEEGSAATCDPWPASGRDKGCGVDEAHFPGEPACVRVGTACPAGDFADGLPASGVVYVLAGAPAGGDGSVAAPFGKIADAVAGAISGEVIALGKGTYDEAVEIDTGVTLWGACVAETIVGSSVPSPPPGAGTLDIDAPGVTLRNLRFGGERAALTIGGSGTKVQLEDVVIDHARDYGLVVHNDGVVSGTSVVVRDTQPELATEERGSGVYMVKGGFLELTRAVLERNTSHGAVTIDSNLTLTDAAVVDTRPRADGLLGEALVSQDQGHVRVLRGALDGNTQAAAYARTESTLDLEDVVVRDTAPEEAGGHFGFGVDAIGGSTVTLRRVLFERNHKAAVLIEESGTSLVGGDVVIRDTQKQLSDGEMGIGLVVQNGGRISLERVLAERSIIAGALAFGGELELTDLVVRGVEDDEPDDAAAAVGGTDGAHVVLRRARLEGSRRAGLQLDRAASLVAEDLVVRDLLPGSGNGNFGRGLQITSGAVAQITRVVVQRARDLGAVGFGEGTSLDLIDATIEQTLASCAETTCVDEAGGVGVGAYDLAFVRATRFLVKDAAFCGVQVATGGVLELHQGEVSTNPIGANVQDASFDLARLEDCVSFRDNVRNLDAAILPLPPVGDQLH